MMRFSICNELFEGWDFSRVCGTAAAMGYTGVEIAPFTLGDRPCEFPSAARQVMAEQAAAAGLEIVGLHWLLARTEGFHISHPDPEVRGRTSEYLLGLVRLCSDLEGQVMVFGSPAQRSILDGVSRRDAWRYAVETLRKLVSEVESHGITLCIEPLSGQETNFINTAAEASMLIKELDSPNVNLILDGKAMSSEQAAPDQIVLANGDILAHVHANDANMRGPGFGITDWVPIANALKSVRYDGWVSVEVFDFTPDPVTIAEQSIDYLRKCFAV